jgi:hypothetical protein
MIRVTVGGDSGRIWDTFATLEEAQRFAADHAPSWSGGVRYEQSYDDDTGAVAWEAIDVVQS